MERDSLLLSAHEEPRIRPVNDHCIVVWLIKLAADHCGSLQGYLQELVDCTQFFVVLRDYIGTTLGNVLQRSCIVRLH